jgi:PBSX family phage terminase large subunit
MTIEYQIAELAPGETGGFSPRGAVRTLWKTRNFETIVAGPAETGKTWGCLQYVDSLLWKYPKAQGVMARKVYSSLVGSAVRTYLRILGDGSPVHAFGGEQPQWFDYPNGSRLWLAGLDKPGKALSSERDFIYVNQAEELSLNDWETLTTRCTGRGAVMPYTRMFGDCNPDTPTHWIKQRLGLVVLESRHEDNPALYDENGEITPQGEKSIAILDALTGVRWYRLRKGKWVQAEGVVYDGWDNAVHVIDRMPEGWRSWRKVRSIDFGFTNPFTCQWWAVDGDGRGYLYRQIYKTRTLVEDHAKEILKLSADDGPIEATVADHDAEDRATLERHGVFTIPAIKGIKQGIELVSARLRDPGDGKRRLYVLRDSLVERDEDLAATYKPVDFISEVDSYVYPKGKDGKPVKEKPVDMNNHGCDAARYFTAYVDLQGPLEIVSEMAQTAQ